MDKEKELAELLDLVADYGQARFNVGKGVHGADSSKALDKLAIRLRGLLDMLEAKYNMKEGAEVFAPAGDNGKAVQGVMLKIERAHILSGYGKDAVRKLTVIHMIQAALTSIAGKGEMDPAAETASFFAQAMEKITKDLAMTTVLEMSKSPSTVHCVDEFLATGDVARLSPIWEEFKKKS